MSELIREDAKAKGAAVTRRPVTPVASEGVFKTSPGEAPTKIRHAVIIETSFREPKSDGPYKEKRYTIEYAEIPNMSEPRISSCPTWDDLAVYSTRDHVEIGALGLTIPTVMKNGESGPDGQTLRLKSEVRVGGFQDMTSFDCELKVTSEAVSRQPSALRNPWIRSGPNCPEGLEVVEGPVRPRYLLMSSTPIPTRMLAHQRANSQEILVAPEDGVFTIGEATSRDLELEQAHDRAHNSMLDATDEPAVCWF